MVKVLQIRQVDCGRIDRAVIGQLENALGPHRSREVIEEACFEIIEHLTRFEVAHVTFDMREAWRLARTVAAISDEIGMPDLGCAAQAAAACMSAADPVARAATAQRLLRVGEASLDALMHTPPDAGCS